MKKRFFVDFVGGFLEFIPLRLRELRGFGGLRGTYLPPCGGDFGAVAEGQKSIQ
jgi:hypothetical protein